MSTSTVVRGQLRIQLVPLMDGQSALQWRQHAPRCLSRTTQSTCCQSWPTCQQHEATATTPTLRARSHVQTSSDMSNRRLTSWNDRRRSSLTEQCWWVGWYGTIHCIVISTHLCRPSQKIRVKRFNKNIMIAATYCLR